MKYFIKIILLLLSGFVPLALLHSQSELEKIHDYNITIKVRPDRSLLIQEDIKVYANNEEINRGIYRDIPQSRALKGGLVHRYDVQVQEIRKNGEPEPYHTEDNYNLLRVYIGDEDVYLDPGMYQYSIIYTVSDALESVSNSSVLYWNVIGDQWKFPILHASLKLWMPEGSARNIQDRQAWQGKSGSTDSDYDFSRNGDQMEFKLRHSLKLGEGWTIRLQWQDDTIQPLSRQEAIAKLVKDNRGMFFIMGGILFVFIYYLLAWAFLGKDPEKGSIMTYYEAPESLSPASMRFISNMGYDQKIFTTAIISMAVKGHIKINESNDIYTLNRQNEDYSLLSPEEAAVSKELFESGPSIKVENANHQDFKEAIRACKDSLKKNYVNILFISNKHIFIPGLIATIAIMIGGVALNVGNFAQIFILIWLSFWNVGVFFLLRQVVLAWKKAGSSSRHRFLNTGAAIFMTFFSSFFVGADLVVFGIFLNMGPSALWMVLFFATAVVMNYTFFRLLKAPTLAGRKIMDKIEGFRRYIDVTEKKQMEYFNPPEKTVTNFEKFLPYALAFDMEKNWAGYFNEVMSSLQENRSWSPHWYQGSSFNTLSFSEFSSSLGSSLSSAFSTASASPSSGSSGGSSGGGGGGGGGGGW